MAQSYHVNNYLVYMQLYFVTITWSKPNNEQSQTQYGHPCVVGWAVIVSPCVSFIRFVVLFITAEVDGEIYNIGGSISLLVFIKGRQT